MNKLIIVGNGFDIHNGLPTKYSDFLKWIITKAIESNELEELVDIESSEIVNQHVNNSLIVDSIGEIVDYFLDYKNGYFINEGKPFYFKSKFRWFNFNVNKMSEFLKSLFSHQSDKNWVDIEMMYYQKLKKCLKLMQKDEKSIEDETKLLS